MACGTITADPTTSTPLENCSEPESTRGVRFWRYGVAQDGLTLATALCGLLIATATWHVVAMLVAVATLGLGAGYCVRWMHRASALPGAIVRLSMAGAGAFYSAWIWGQLLQLPA